MTRSQGELLRAVALAALVSVVSTSSARGAYSGRVFAWIPAPDGEALFRAPVAGATISIEGFPALATDESGRFAIGKGAGTRRIEAFLSGPGIALHSAAGTEFRIRAAIAPGLPLAMEFPREWASASAAFIHAEEARRRFSALDLDPPVIEPPLPIRIIVDRPGPCEMGYDPSTGDIFFPAPDPSCPLPAERTIVFHEVAHAFLAEIYGILEPLDLQEGLADAAATLAAGVPWIGRGVYGPGTRLREVETDAVHPVPGNAYDRGLALAGALWDLRSRLIHQGARDGDGLALRLWYAAARSLPRTLGPEVARALLDADESLGGGNGRVIREALSAHGLVDTPLPAPAARDLRAALEGRVVHLAWQGDPDRTGSIRIERDGREIAVLDAGARAYADPGVRAGPHTYLVGEAGRDADPHAVVWVAVRTFRRGDANDDGAIDAKDAIRTLGMLFRREEIACLDAADVDDDGLVRINDPVALLLALFGEADLPPPPFAAYGEDPTADGLGCGPP